MSGCELTKRFIRKHSVHLGMHSRKEEMRKNIVELEVHLGDDPRLINRIRIRRRLHTSVNLRILQYKVFILDSGFNFSGLEHLRVK